MKLLQMTFLTWLAVASSLQAKKDAKEILSVHETEATFTKIVKRTCRGRTARCPKKCGHSGEFAMFTIDNYLTYKKPGKYGDAKAKTYMIQISKVDGDKSVEVGHFGKMIRALKPGEKLFLNWTHFYVTKNNSSYPVREVSKLALRPSVALKLTVPSGLYSLKVKSADANETVLEVVKSDGMGMMMLTERTATVSVKSKKVRIICDNPELIKGMNKDSKYSFEKRK